MKLYVSGPMSGLPELNFPAFAECAEALRRKGYEVVSPHEKGGEGDESEEAWFGYLKADITAMMGCDAIVLLRDWPKSRGAKLELSIAIGLGLKVFYWLDYQLWGA